METEVIALIGAVVLIILMLLGVHIAIALVTVGVVGLALITGTESALKYVVRSFYTTANTYSFSVLPLFILMGSFAAASGISRSGYELAYRFFSNLKAGLYLVTVASCAVFGACTGSAAACTIAVGKVVLPEMERLGYQKQLSVACVAAAGTLAVMIPPSVVMVIYGIATDESIGKLLLSGVFPGILSAIVYMIGLTILVKFRPYLAAPITIRYTWKERFKAIPPTWGIALLFFTIIFGIYSGVFTATEAGAVGAFLALILLALNKKKQVFKSLISSGWESLQSFVMVFFTIMTAIVFSNFLNLSGVMQSLTTFITDGGFDRLTVLLIIIIALGVAGMFMSGAAMILLIAPIAHQILIPLGYDGIWLGVIMVKMFELGAITPPVGLGAFVARAISPTVSIEEIFKSLTIFVLLEGISITILVIFPEISTWLPTQAFAK